MQNLLNEPISIQDLARSMKQARVWLLILVFGMTITGGCTQSPSPPSLLQDNRPTNKDGYFSPPPSILTPGNIPSANANPIAPEDRPLTWGESATDDLQVSDLHAFNFMGDTDGLITGKISNHTDSALRYVEVDFVLLNDRGNQTDNAMTNTTDLAPHTTWEFKVHTLTKDWSKFKLVRVQGDRQ